MRSRTLIPISLVAVAALSLLAASLAGAFAPTAAPRMQNGVLAYSDCMRSQGVSNFPAPDSSGGIPKDKVVPLVSSPRFQVAQSACQHLMPNGGLGRQETAQQTRVRLADALSFARCMRSHGVSRFPDPTTNGDLSLEMVQAQGIDVHSPATLQAVWACLPASHGSLTAAKVRAALADAGG